mmetsp:Transcript_33263/g.106179  ORF Transcript_33263/g.106179 Transcript_33263/m.106179 type:complete len:204 (+) Transcript_33263:207-818(+)
MGRRLRGVRGLSRRARRLRRLDSPAAESGDGHSLRQGGDGGAVTECEGGRRRLGCDDRLGQSRELAELAVPRRRHPPVGRPLQFNLQRIRRRPRAVRRRVRVDWPGRLQRRQRWPAPREERVGEDGVRAHRDRECGLRLRLRRRPAGYLRGRGGLRRRDTGRRRAAGVGVRLRALQVARRRGRRGGAALCESRQYRCRGPRRR